MNEREFGEALRRHLDGYGAYDAHPALPALVEPARQHRWRSLLSAAGVVLAVAAVVGILLLPRLSAGLRGARTPVATPPATPVPTAAPSALLVPDPAAHDLARIDWSGQKLGSVTLPEGGILTRPSPDGALVMVDGRDGSLSLVSGASGELVGSVSLAGTTLGVLPIWADDSRHACDTRLTPSGPVVAVVTVDPATARIEQRTIPVQGLPAGSPPLIGACSVRTDRVVLSAFAPTGATALAGAIQVLRLSDGTPLLHLDYPSPAPFANVRVSPDARYLAGSTPGGVRPAHTTVIDLTTGQQAAQLDGVGEQFSADDRYLAVSSFTSEVPVTGGTGSLVEWRTGRTVWQGQGQLAIVGYEPAGQAIAVQVSGGDLPPPDQNRFLIVRPDGSAITIEQNGALTPAG